MLRHLDDLLRILYVAILLAAAVFFGWWAFMVLDNLWADYQDGSDETYLIVGGLLGVASFALASLGLASLRGAGGFVKVSSLAIGVTVGVAIIVALVQLYGP